MSCFFKPDSKRVADEGAGAFTQLCTNVISTAQLHSNTPPAQWLISAQAETVPDAIFPLSS